MQLRCKVYQTKERNQSKTSYLCSNPRDRLLGHSSQDFLFISLRSWRSAYSSESMALGNGEHSAISRNKKTCPVKLSAMMEMFDICAVPIQ